MNPVLIVLEVVLAGVILLALTPAARKRSGFVGTVTRGHSSMSVLLTVFGFFSSFYVPPVVFSELSPVWKTTLYLSNTAAIFYMTLLSSRGRNTIIGYHQKLRQD